MRKVLLLCTIRTLPSPCCLRHRARTLTHVHRQSPPPPYFFSSLLFVQLPSVRVLASWKGGACVRATCDVTERIELLSLIDDFSIEKLLEQAATSKGHYRPN